MILELSDADAQELHELLHDYLPELKREVARTDVRTLRHELAQRQEMCERLLAELGATLDGSSAAAPTSSVNTQKNVLKPT